MKFADANSNYEDSQFVIFGIPYEDTEMSFRCGASEAPKFIRYAGWNYESYDILSGVDLRDTMIFDAGNFELNNAIPFFKKVIKNGKIPIILGGSHSITPPLIASVDTELGVLMLDAHMDFREEYSGDPTSHACVARRIFEKIGKNNSISIGVRSSSKKEIKDAKKLGYNYVLSQDYNKNVVNKIPFDKIYLSIDMDVFDPCYAPGVSNPEPNGLGYELFDFIKAISKRVIAMDVVEISPSYDDGRTALLAAKLIRDFICLKIAYTK